MRRSKYKNCLDQYHCLFTDTPILFRDRVAKECGWSIPTYYRKMRLRDKLNADGQVDPALSNAEKDMIKRVAKEMKGWFGGRLDRIAGKE
ncbi:hypothetical protein [Chitinophaga sp. sic0106]|uniref:hypothetical protein n=1 Tax=Chitinophaga sp. sic0106 TaxID=2854785 RepID=UPI001C48B9D9|nr:hypothetical protein [Chitinophaga sp. sic0106]MBV7530833.1 hypothetical protein [Chitinophaga sp. sic0106]